MTTTSEHSIDTLTVQGVEVPRIALGTWELTGNEAREAVADAISIGYRHIDTAIAYENEKEVGQGIADSGVARDELFVTTKVWRDDAAEDGVRASIETSLDALELDYVDLLLIHWPNPDVPVAETLGALTQVKADGLAKLIGVSNYPVDLLTEALGHGPVACDQVEFHPFLEQPEILAIARDNDMFVGAYSPLAHGKVHDSDVLSAIGGELGRAPEQVALRWLLDSGPVVVLPRSSSHDNRVSNFDLSFELTDEHRAQIAELPKDRRQVDPGFAPDWDE